MIYCCILCVQKQSAKWLTLYVIIVDFGLPVLWWSKSIQRFLVFVLTNLLVYVDVWSVLYPMRSLLIVHCSLCASINAHMDCFCFRQYLTPLQQQLCSPNDYFCMFCCHCGSRKALVFYKICLSVWLHLLHWYQDDVNSGCVLFLTDLDFGMERVMQELGCKAIGIKVSVLLSLAFGTDCSALERRMKLLTSV